MEGRKSVTRCLSELSPSPLPREGQPSTMVELKSIFKKAYWSLAAGGLLYVLFVCSMTYPEVQRLYVSFRDWLCRMANRYSLLYANKVNPTYWQDVNQVESFGFLSMIHHNNSGAITDLLQGRKSSLSIW